MKPQRLVLALSLSLLALTALRAATPQMDVADIRPGMVGIGRTVFDGTRVEEFRAHIIGVIENVIGTQRNLILAKLEGGPLANTGVIAGMSGSPVYVDGKLIGAVSYALGSFSKEPIAGITPIAEMTDATAFSGPRPAGARVNVDLPITSDSLVAAFQKALTWNQPFARRATDTQLIGVSSVAGVGGEIGTLLRPIATPLVMSGFEPSMSGSLMSAFRDAGFMPMGASAAAARAGMAEFDGPLKPGDAVGVTFVSGDLELGATGTVTHIDDNKVYAFGHPMYNLGPIDFPMTRAYVYTVLPSLFSSAKLSSTGEVIGAFNQDRATAIAGRLGPAPALLPVTMTLESERGGGNRSFRFNAVKDQLFGPLMTYTALVNTLTSYERQFGTTTYEVQGRLRLKGHDPILFDNMFAGENAASNTSAYLVAPVTAMVNNDYETVDMEGLDIAVKSTEQPRTATLERVWIDDQKPRPGRTVSLKVLLRSYRGDDIIQTIPVQIPANARGSLALMVSDGQRLNQSEQREARLPQPRSVPQLVRSLNKARRNNTIYVKLLGSDAGAVVSGELLSSLPPSVLAVLESDHSSGNVNPLQTATLGEWQLRTEQAISGVRTLTIQLSAN
ncbi:MAG TPA: SpoIVB peptidase S55 domain-containing protein [Vicinamibacterales bacterium]|nr:SpoIVB peptidase S55 domain-containing protein [Vicinamibacterales bacterium]